VLARLAVGAHLLVLALDLVFLADVAAVLAFLLGLAAHALVALAARVMHLAAVLAARATAMLSLFGLGVDLRVRRVAHRLVVVVLTGEIGAAGFAMTVMMFVTVTSHDLFP
jgi:hypothetical protein